MKEWKSEDLFQRSENFYNFNNNNNNNINNNCQIKLIILLYL